jgi:hypothetical protein
MNRQASASFTIDRWEEEPYDQRDGVRLVRTRVTKTFRGEVEGTSTAELLMVHGQVDGSAAYVGVERFAGRVQGRAGSFVFLHTATSQRGEQSATWPVVADTAAGELHGLRGTARISVEADGGHSFTLDYELESD